MAKYPTMHITAMTKSPMKYYLLQNEQIVILKYLISGLLENNIRSELRCFGSYFTPIQFLKQLHHTVTLWTPTLTQPKCYSAHHSSLPLPALPSLCLPNLLQDSPMTKTVRLRVSSKHVHKDLSLTCFSLSPRTWEVLQIYTRWPIRCLYHRQPAQHCWNWLHTSISRICSTTSIPPSLWIPRRCSFIWYHFCANSPWLFMVRVVEAVIRLACNIIESEIRMYQY